MKKNKTKEFKLKWKWIKNKTNESKLKYKLIKNN